MTRSRACRAATVADRTSRSVFARCQRSLDGFPASFPVGLADKPAVEHTAGVVSAGKGRVVAWSGNLSAGSCHPAAAQFSKEGIGLFQGIGVTLWHRAGDRKAYQSQ